MELHGHALGESMRGFVLCLKCSLPCESQRPADALVEGTQQATHVWAVQIAVTVKPSFTLPVAVGGREAPPRCWWKCSIAELHRETHLAALRKLNRGS